MLLPSKVVLSTLAAVVFPGMAPAAGDLVITDPISRATPAGAPTGIGHMTIANDGEIPDRLVAATSPLADRVGLHEMSVANGIMTMRPVPGASPFRRTAQWHSSRAAFTS